MNASCITLFLNPMISKSLITYVCIKRLDIGRTSFKTYLRTRATVLLEITINTM